jgi:hypothetical protein
MPGKELTMQIELTEQQRQAQEAHDPEPLRVINARTNQAFVLVPVELYERLKSALDNGFDPRETYPLVDQIMGEDDANDPHLESYQHVRRENRS